MMSHILSRFIVNGGLCLRLDDFLLKLNFKYTINLQNLIKYTNYSIPNYISNVY